MVAAIVLGGLTLVWLVALAYDRRHRAKRDEALISWFRDRVERRDIDA